MRKVFVVAILIGIIILLAYYFSRPKPLRPIAVTWQEVGIVRCFVDLNADGNDELFVIDHSGQWRWVQFSPTTTIRQKIPVPKGASLRHDIGITTLYRAQLLTFEPPQTHQVFIVTRQGKRWAVKDLGKLKGNEFVEVKDADHDGQVNDVVVWRGQTRKVFSRLKDGTIVERPDLPDWRADLDGDGKDDAVYAMFRQVSYLRTEEEVQVHFSSGRKATLRLWFPITIVDMDGDKVAEIVDQELISSLEYRLHCWRYRNGGWHKSSSPKFEFGDAWLGFPSEWRRTVLLRDEKGAYLLVVTKEGQRVKVWKVQWRKGKWTKRLMGEVPKHNAEFVYFVFIRVGRDWIVFGDISPPKWQKWLWDKVGQHLKRFLPFLQEPQLRFFVYGWDGKRRWTLLGRWNRRHFKGYQLADMDGDGKRELALAFPKKVLVAKFEDGRWQTGWVKVPFELQPILITHDGFRYGGREWALFQERDGNRCVAIALEGDGQQSKRHQPQRRN